MFLIKLNDDNIVININGIDILGDGIKSNDKLKINKAILLSIAAKPIKEKFCKNIYIYSPIGNISLHDDNKKLMYISNGWCWYGIAKFENIFENKYAYDIEKYLSFNILKEKCILTKKLYYCLINNSSVSHYYSDLYPLLSEHFANEYDK